MALDAVETDAAQQTLGEVVFEFGYCRAVKVAKGAGKEIYVKRMFVVCGHHMDKTVKVPCLSGLGAPSARESSSAPHGGLVGPVILRDMPRHRRLKGRWEGDSFGPVSQCWSQRVASPPPGSRLWLS